MTPWGYYGPTAALIIGCTVCLGCTEVRQDTVSVSGSVQYKGTPISYGEIRLIPIGGEGKKVVGGLIEHGSYQLSKKQEINAGTYRVEVFAYRNLDSSKETIDFSNPESNFVQYLPDKFNSKSSITLEVDSGATSLCAILLLSKFKLD